MRDVVVHLPLHCTPSGYNNANHKKAAKHHLKVRGLILFNHTQLKVWLILFCIESIASLGGYGFARFRFMV